MAARSRLKLLPITAPLPRDFYSELGIDVQRFYKYYDQKFFSSRKLNEATFFDKETFGEDRLVFEEDRPIISGRGTRRRAAEQIPIAPEARRDLLRLQDAKVDYLPGLSPRAETGQADPEKLQGFSTAGCQSASRCREDFPDHDARFIRGRHRCSIRL